MVSAGDQNEFHDIAPPTDKNLEIKDKLSLLLEAILIHLLIFPHILYVLYRTVFPSPEKSLKGKMVLVTGAGRGLGRGLALGFAREGCKVAVVDVNINNAENTAEEITKSGGTAKAYSTNVVKVEEVKALRKAVTKDLGPVDILVNNAGLVYFGGNVEESAEEEISAVISVNLLSHFWMIREFLPAMKERNSGHIVAIASIASYCAIANGTAYVASKFGVNGLMEAIRLELKTRSNNKIKTTTVFPYFINTSADYVDRWDIRFPPTSIKRAVETIVTAVKRDQVHVTVPAYLYPFVLLLKLMPRSIQDRYTRFLHLNVLPQTKEAKDMDPITKIVKGLSKKEN